MKKTVRTLGRAAARGVTLVEVLIVVSIMAVISGGAVVLAFPLYKEARIKTAVVSAKEIKKAAQLYQEMDATGDGCPTIQDLVTSKRLDLNTANDPWGKPFRIVCGEGDIRVLSAGNDRKEGTPDDIRDDFTPVDVKRVKEL
ncbi:MAG: type II secretion system protein [Byssovorax sp.]